jgi:hypothetical protein
LPFLLSVPLPLIFPPTLLLAEPLKLPVLLLMLSLPVSELVDQPLRVRPAAWAHVTGVPPLQLRVRLGCIQRIIATPEACDTRLKPSVCRTAQAQLFANGNDGGRLS